MAAAVWMIAGSTFGRTKEPEPKPSLFPLSIDWTLELSGAPSAAPIHDGAQLYVPMRSGKVVAVGLGDGCVTWSVRLVTDRPPTAGDQAVYVSTADAIHALSPRDGAPLWRAELGGDLAVTPVWDTGWLVAGLTQGDLMAIRGDNGQQLWRRPLGSSLAASPVLYGPRLYAPLRDGRIVALEVTTGETIWERQLPGHATDVLVVPERVFVGSSDNFFYALSDRDGKTEWRWRTGADIVGAPVVDESQVYFLSLDNVLRGLDRNVGNQRWKQDLLIRPSSGPQLLGEVLLIAGLNEQIEGYYAADGSPVGTFEAPAELASPPLIYAEPAGEQVLLVLTGEGHLQQLRRGTDPALVPLTYIPGIPSPPELEPLTTLPGTELTLEPLGLPAPADAIGTLPLSDTVGPRAHGALLPLPAGFVVHPSPDEETLRWSSLAARVS